jgi:hypothetical protein
MKIDSIELFYELGSLLLGSNSEAPTEKEILSKVFLGYWLIWGSQGLVKD